jgi:hypothetical protein
MQGLQNLRKTQDNLFLSRDLNLVSPEYEGRPRRCVLRECVREYIVCGCKDGIGGGRVWGKCSETTQGSLSSRVYFNFLDPVGIFRTWTSEGYYSVVFVEFNKFEIIQKKEWNEIL